ncbi:hypothetical protein EC988_009464, partial [Linderina pennispora]
LYGYTEDMPIESSMFGPEISIFPPRSAPPTCCTSHGVRGDVVREQFFDEVRDDAGLFPKPIMLLAARTLLNSSWGLGGGGGAPNTASFSSLADEPHAEVALLASAEAADGALPAARGEVDVESAAEDGTCEEPAGYAARMGVAGSDCVPSACAAVAA